MEQELLAIEEINSLYQFYSDRYKALMILLILSGCYLCEGLCTIVFNIIPTKIDICEWFMFSEDWSQIHSWFGRDLISVQYQAS